MMCAATLLRTRATDGNDHALQRHTYQLRHRTRQTTLCQTPATGEHLSGHAAPSHRQYKHQPLRGTTAPESEHTSNPLRLPHQSRIDWPFEAEGQMRPFDCRDRGALRG